MSHDKHLANMTHEDEETTVNQACMTKLLIQISDKLLKMDQFVKN